MKFILEIDLGAGAVASDPGAELGRILRYWGGATKDLDLSSSRAEQDAYDSSYAKVGTWRLES